MGRFVDIPYDVFFEVLVSADAESVFSLGQCNRFCRKYANEPLLWKEIARRMQEQGVQLPAEGFAGIENMTFRQLKRSVLRACRIRRAWSSLETRPTKSYTVDCSLSRHQLGVLHVTQRLRKIFPITENFFAVKLGFHLSSNVLQIWHRDYKTPRISVTYQNYSINWGHCIDLAEKTWYFIYSELGRQPPGQALRVMRFTGFDSDPRIKMKISMVAKFPVYGFLVNVFVLNVVRRSLCALYAGLRSGTVALFFIPDWLKKDCAYIDTGVEDNYRTKNDFICTLDAQNEQLVMQFEVDPKQRTRQYVFALQDLERCMHGSLSLSSSSPSPMLLKPTQVFDVEFMNTPLEQGSWHEVKSIISVDHDYRPIFPRAPGTRALPAYSHVACTSTFAYDLQPSYAFKHLYVGARGQLYRTVTPVIRRMAFEQDFMGPNTSERFPVGHALDLHGHELIALGHACAAWIEASPADDPPPTNGVDQLKFDLKIASFPWNMEGPGQKDASRAEVVKNERIAERSMAVCTVVCPPEVDLAAATGLWLDAAQGRLFIGQKWGKFMVLQFD